MKRNLDLDAELIYPCRQRTFSLKQSPLVVTQKLFIVQLSIHGIGSHRFVPTKCHIFTDSTQDTESDVLPYYLGYM